MANWPGYSVTLAVDSLENEAAKFIIDIADYEGNYLKIEKPWDTYIIHSSGNTPWLGTLKPLCDMIEEYQLSADLTQRCGNLCVGHTFKWRRGECIYQNLFTLPDMMLLHEAEIKGIDIPRELSDKVFGDEIPNLKDQVDEYYSNIGGLFPEEVEQYNKEMDLKFEEFLKQPREWIEIEDPYKEYYELVKNTPYPDDYPFTPTNDSEDDGLELPIDPYYSEDEGIDEDVNDDILPF